MENDKYNFKTDNSHLEENMIFIKNNEIDEKIKKEIEKETEKKFEDKIKELEKQLMEYKNKVFNLI